MFDRLKLIEFPVFIDEREHPYRRWTVENLYELIGFLSLFRQVHFLIPDPPPNRTTVLTQISLFTRSFVEADRVGLNQFTNLNISAGIPDTVPARRAIYDFENTIQHSITSTHTALRERAKRNYWSELCSQT